jgi:hypothetical protein
MNAVQVLYLLIVLVAFFLASLSLYEASRPKPKSAWALWLVTLLLIWPIVVPLVLR